MVKTIEWIGKYYALGDDGKVYIRCPHCDFIDCIEDTEADLNRGVGKTVAEFIRDVVLPWKSINGFEPRHNGVIRQ